MHPTCQNTPPASYRQSRHTDTSCQSPHAHRRHSAPTLLSSPLVYEAKRRSRARGKKKSLGNRDLSRTEPCASLQRYKEVYLPVTLKCTLELVLVTFHSHAKHYITNTRIVINDSDRSYEQVVQLTQALTYPSSPTHYNLSLIHI